MANDSPRRRAHNEPLIPAAPRRDSENAPQATHGPAPTDALTYAEPSITCDGCGKAQIQYELHENCSICKGGNYNLCHRCYKLNKGCNNWFGFGSLAWHYYQRQAAPQQDLPHALVGRQYLPPKLENLQRASDRSSTTMTTQDPAKRLLTGAFCSICHVFANDCFWHCDWCNDSEWGYCSRCVNQGRCCTHPLLPLAHVSLAKPQNSPHRLDDTNIEASFAPLTSATMVQTFPPTNVATPGQYRPLTISTTCDVCRLPIQPNQSRYHCYHCANGNYDICATCYAALVDTGRISRESGDQGWRRCPQGHRMIVAYFEDSPVGQRRVIVRDLVGGHFLDDDAPHWPAVLDDAAAGRWRWRAREGGEVQTREAISRRRAYKRSMSGGADGLKPALPPDGGVGMVLVATHAWVPAEGVTDELSFPRGAEIREATETSEDWYEGSYAGAKGLFPAVHTKLLGVVQM